MEKFQFLSLSSLKLGLHDLFDKRHADLLLSNTGRFHEPDLQEKRGEIDALPPVFTGGTPLSAELDGTDAHHDVFGGYVHRTTEMYEQLPGAAPAIVEAGHRIRAALIPDLTELSARYSVEAARAIERKPQLAALKADLQLFPIPTPAGQPPATLYDVAVAFIAAGEKLDELLSARGDVPAGSRKAASTLRPAIIGLLNRMRADLAKELKRDPNLPKDLDQRIFGYFDVLEHMAEQAARAAKAATTPSDPTPAG